MVYQILYTKTALKDIKRLDIIVKKRLKNKIELFATNPLAFSKKLINNSIGQYRFRLGNYRIIFDIEKNRIIILRAGHRREIYKR
ncbi:hypothetical protein AUK04_00970 [Candidatus Roizmanbacteria bacterium CG2_30_33_16]|uniref:Type II toxin-antitoxin system mRNA interferase toxin, RelE/StbE family n=4 Tax=Candidatus Roizmaniibacteriota TaxID=1752723 RepID=A0A2H0C3P0_9BACT|nr:type II toxin-antitoxin system RelE/ParE family toxin [Candidatus Roizmanbacteria bacterium]OIP85849.1 MAG: hypothetical protein AUK04_00970 [Candidatus Roizmanbacteria bacterium CG2_30_33_16]PIP63970.1 MAG: hypothetical protein COW96_05145 [Candidatus Roizmanbacteria bacterium CG22_combo_CG10-13_8_21_14_all_33_16]PIX71125.1 MAG: hypothetical protein COZ39_03875 [Candidatus Roizmanbacteria bacterium CG_4_10_14_3_um_filter_33_21]PJB87732.1 MAG: hypothetical protein CO083_05470 [Candidatus Roi